MNANIYVILGFILTLVIDLVTAAARSGLQNANQSGLLQVHEQLGEQSDRVQKLVHSPLKPYAGIHFFQSICRFVLIGLLFLMSSWVIDSVPAVLFWIILILGGIIVAIFEWLVDRWAARDPELWVSRLGIFIQVITLVFSPLIALGMWLSREPNPQENSVSGFEEDLKLMVETGQQEGVLEEEEGQMIFSIFQLNDTLTREIMVPRIEMLALDVHTPLIQALDTFLESGYSRVPVYDGRMDNVIGILYAKDLLKGRRDGNGKDLSIGSQLREPYFVPEAKKADELLAEMQHRRVHMAIVVDEYGGVAGVVTLEDIIEEILGEIQDEYDVEEMPYQSLEDGSYLFRGRIDLDDFNQIMDRALPPEEADTLGGYIYSRLGHVPVAGESVIEGDLILSVEKVNNRRIHTVRAQLKPSEG
jgi:putative hemolysin